MATPAERKALLFFALVATMGAGVRLWRSHHADTRKGSPAEATNAESYDSNDRPRASARTGSRKTKKAYPGRPSGGRGSSSREKSPAAGRGRGSRTDQIDRDFASTVDLDRASTSEIDALGVLQPGMARLIVADRDSFGPFGSIQELARVPFLSTTVIRKLAPRVTFSRLPRPRNTVIQPRSPDAGGGVPRRARRAKGSIQ